MRGWRGVVVGLVSLGLGMTFPGCGTDRGSGKVAAVHPLAGSVIWYTCNGPAMCAINVDGRGASTVLVPSAARMGASLSPDHRMLAYSSADSSENVFWDSVVAVSALSGGRPRMIWGPEGFDNGNGDALIGFGPSVPGWNPAGTAVAVKEPEPEGPGSPFSGCDLWVIPLSGLGAHRVVRNSICGQGEVAWSPDGRQLAFPGENGPEVVSASGGTPRLLAKVNQLPTGYVESVSWSSNVSTILATTIGSTTSDGYKQSHSVIEAFPVPGGQPKVLVDQPPGPIAVRWTAMYSPDGSKIAFTQEKRPGSKANENNIAVQELVVANADGSDPSIIAHYQEVDARAYITSWS